MIWLRTVSALQRSSDYIFLFLIFFFQWSFHVTCSSICVEPLSILRLLIYYFTLSSRNCSNLVCFAFLISYQPLKGYLMLKLDSILNVHCNHNC